MRVGRSIRSSSVALTGPEVCELRPSLLIPTAQDVGATGEAVACEAPLSFVVRPIAVQTATLSAACSLLVLPTPLFVVRVLLLMTLSPSMNNLVMLAARLASTLLSLSLHFIVMLDAVAPDGEHCGLAVVV